ncbi:hypothetical protein EDL99_10615 [Ornithobacterium rhinotracheale]|uniref:phage minor head protein n=1 Tax=Ornithobacterium rhinotracheale TaxID=28251 RepID=UPI00129C375B|nr:phage minor head protein [Ornithobacterium rhinotracheale]MRJ09307.1 hypothetical protein [Ornithobacterium rhinotracheale]UOH77661.1 phage head morphogenesis protein [Ornithobacterium rhinotracheale]
MEEKQNDWTEILAKKMVNEIRKKMGLHLESAPNEKKEESSTSSFGIDYDAIDDDFRNVLKKNIWKFSAATTYDECIYLNSVLTRQNGSVRPWHEFRREALKKLKFPLDDSVQVEYNTIITWSMMSSKWQEIQRDKHLFPFVQFKVTMDDQTSEICAPLSNVIVQVDDPFLQYYFPPNHFNCRTDVIKLRNATPTPQHLLPKLEISSIFLNNTLNYFTIDEKSVFRVPISDENLKILKRLFISEL